jgi:DNA polymerase V
MAKLFALVYCDNFFVSCERIFNPSLEGKPVILLSSREGWVVARSPEAEAIGIRIGVPIAQVEAIIQKYGVVVQVANSALYRDISGRLMSALQQFCPELEMHNLDQACLELAIAPDHSVNNLNSVTIEPIVTPHNLSISDYAQEICRKIEQWLGIPIAIGIAPTKTLAKVANQLAQASAAGVATLLTTAEQSQALAATPVNQVWGIGSYYAQQLEAIGIINALQLSEMPEAEVQHLFDPGVIRTIWELRGQVCFPLQPEATPRQEAIMFRTFGEPVKTIAALNEVAAIYVAVLAQKLHNEALLATSISITLATDRHCHESNEPQYYNSTQIKLPYPTSDVNELTKQAIAGLATIFMPDFRYQKLGITLSELITVNGLESESLLERSAQQRAKRLRQMVNKVNAEVSEAKAGLSWFGDLDDREERSIKPCWQEQLASRSQRYTTEWNELPIAKA